MTRVRGSVLVLTALSIVCHVSVPALRASSGMSVVESFSIEKLEAWAHPDGSYRYNLTIRNNSDTAFHPSMGRFTVAKKKLVGSSWKPAGGHPYTSLAAGDTMGVQSNTFSSEAASKLEVYIYYPTYDHQHARKTVTVASEPPAGFGPDGQAIDIVKSMLIQDLVCYWYPDGSWKFRCRIKNTSGHDFTPSMGRFWSSARHDASGQFNGPMGGMSYTSLPSGESKFYQNTGDSLGAGAKKMRVALSYDGVTYKERVVNLTALDEAKAKALEVAEGISISGFEAWKYRIGGKGGANFVVKNNSSESHTATNPPLLKVKLQRLVRVKKNGRYRLRWYPAGGFGLSSLAAGASKSYENPKMLNASGASKMRVFVEFLGKKYGTQETVPTVRRSVPKKATLSKKASPSGPAGGTSAPRRGHRPVGGLKQ